MRKSLVAMFAGIGLTATALAPSPSASENGQPLGSGESFVVPAADTEKTETILIDGTPKKALPATANVNEMFDSADVSDLDVARLSKLASAIERKNPTQYVTAGRLGGRLVIHLLDRPGNVIIDQLTNFGLPLEVRYGGSINIVTQERLADRALDLVAEVPELTPIMAGLNATADTLEIRLSNSGDVPVDRYGSKIVENLAKDSGLPNGLPVDVSFITQEPSSIKLQSTVKGGYRLDNSNSGGTALCTTGFSARRNGVLGVVTARHCPTNLDYASTSGVIQNQGIATAGSAVDLRFYRTLSGHGTTRGFRATPTQERLVEDVANPATDQRICLYGIRTRYACDYVRNGNPFCAPSGESWGNSCGLVEIRGNITEDGDSGGPWFFGDTANGIHTGALTQGGVTRSIFTRIGTVENNLEASLLQGSG